MSRLAKAQIVLSDLHLGEGRRNWDGTINVLEDFTVDTKFAELIRHYSQAYDELEIVLNGNVFEMMRCRAVGDSPDILHETYAKELIRVEMDGHPEVIEALREFMKEEKSRLVYLLGETDIGVLWPAVQAEIKERISDRIEFYPNEYLKGGIHIQHGHQFDAMYASDKAQPTREREGLRVLKLPWGAFFYAHFIQPLRRIKPQFYRVRPMRTYLLWALFFETKFFMRIVRQFLRLVWRAISSRSYPGTSWFDLFKVFSQAADSEALESYAEILLTSDDVQKVIFGHAHIPNYRQFRNGKEYFNSGTWTRNLSLDMRSLGSSHRLSYVLIEYRSEGKEPQAKLMEWHGRHQVIEDYI